jgi:protein-tyrosine phosphatase
LLENQTTEGSGVERLIEVQRRCSVSPNPFERVMGSLLMAARLRKCLSVLPNERIGELMFDHVWNVVDVFSPEMTVCQEATERLLGSKLGGQMMTRVWERAVFVGSLKDADDLATANITRIAAVLSLCPEEIERKNQAIHYMRVPIPDAQPISTHQFREIMAAIEHGLQRGNLLIHCAAGYSRSPILAAAWMHRNGDLSFEAALQQIARVRSTIDPSPILLKSVKEELSR